MLDNASPCERIRRRLPCKVRVRISRGRSGSGGIWRKMPHLLVAGTTVPVSRSGLTP
ncbi:hypothetical protein KCP70_21020 [Salmonella enterica subsp. enterica]|nr:hypothetical protein KCP70_21020 [Salmonella enterica subsp. enterica]